MKALRAAHNSKIHCIFRSNKQDRKLKQISKMPHSLYAVACCAQCPKMTQELTEIEFKRTFGNGMTDITQMEIDEPIDIWSYVKELVENQTIDNLVLEKELVEKVYRNDLKTYDHILLPTNSKNVFMTIIIDLKTKSIFGHKLLDLNKRYGN